MLAKPRIMASIVIAAILAMLVGAASSWALGQFRQAAEARRHGLEVFESAVDLIASLQEAEGSQLSYPLLRDQALQVSYLAAKDQAGASFERLCRLTRDRFALDHLETLVPLLDLQMPGLDGFLVIEGLRSLDPLGYVPILVITAQPAQKLRALQAGARDFVSKPFEVP